MDTLLALRPEAAPVADTRIGSITYRSRANGKPRWRELDALTRAAQGRNRAAGLTGLLLYEDERFFQCIEGPPDELEPVWESIRRDPRHREVEVVSMRVGEVRLFAGWDMRWVRKGEQAADADGVGPGLDFLEPAQPSERLARRALDHDAAELTSALEQSHPRASLDDLLDYVIEPTARALGDAWLRDEIRDGELSAALGRLNVVVHRRAQREARCEPNGRRLLVAAAPGDRHTLGAVAVAERHVNAGWQVDLEFPESVDALVRLVASARYDRVDVATSEALDRGWRAHAEALGERLVAASLNPDVEVTWGGRAFWAPGAESARAGCVFRSSAARPPV